MSKTNGGRAKRQQKSTTPTAEGAMIRVGEAARMLGWSEWQTLLAARRGSLPCRRDGRSVWFSRSELQRWIDGGDRQPLTVSAKQEA